MSVNPFYNIENPELVGYEYAWVEYFRNGICNADITGKKICESWSRCSESGLAPTDGKAVARACSMSKYEKLMKENTKLLEIADAIIDSVVSSLTDKRIGVYITDSEGIVMRFRGERREDSFLGDVRTELREDRSGTNCVDFALRYLEAVSIIGAQHYYQKNHKYAGYAAPIRDVDGRLRGAIGVFVGLEHMNDYMISVVSAAAKAIENGLGVYRSHRIIEQQNDEKQEILDNVTDGIIYLDRSRRITYANKQFLDFIGRGKPGLIGKDVGTINMRPRVTELLDELSNHTNLSVKLIGDDRSYKCLLNHHPVSGSNDNEILIFTATDEIREMASAIAGEGETMFTFDSIIGVSEPIRDCIDMAKKAADHGARVIIEGESGTGKEMFAQAIHNRSARADGPFVAVDCGAIPRELLESELFGYEEGAFTGAKKGGRRGRFEQAHTGTLFLDEIGNMPMDMQAKLLRVLQGGMVTRLGGQQAVKADVQIIAATNLDLLKEVEVNKFREDLYYRLNIVNIKVPPLRERREDIPLLINHFIESLRGRTGVREIDDEAIGILSNYSWPGNVRQLHNVIEQIMIFAEGSSIKATMLPDSILRKTDSFSADNGGVGDIDDLGTVSVRYACNICERLGGNIKRTAEVLGVSRSTVYRMLRDAGYTGRTVRGPI
jgi:transcriptional regulator with PAS, ATPase and Fis domain